MIIPNPKNDPAFSAFMAKQNSELKFIPERELPSYILNQYFDAIYKDFQIALHENDKKSGTLLKISTGAYMLGLVLELFSKYEIATPPEHFHEKMRYVSEYSSNVAPMIDELLKHMRGE